MDKIIRCKNCQRRIIRSLDEGVPYVHFDGLMRICTHPETHVISYAEPVEGEEIS